MDIYWIFKFLHVICAIAWVGEGLTLLANSIIAVRAKGDAELFKSLDTMNNLGKTWFIPVSFATVVFGVITAVLSGSIFQFWVLLGLAGVVVLIGPQVLGGLGGGRRPAFRRSARQRARRRWWRGAGRGYGPLAGQNL